uniref:Alternative oxidase n=1 Tax=Hirondellea gigas TaxID=1518452 RepID=A0A2P2IG48_9CRUS
MLQRTLIPLRSIGIVGSRRCLPVSFVRMCSTSEKDSEKNWELTHPRQRALEKADYMMTHPIWTTEELNSVEITHRPCEKLSDYIAYGSVSLLRFNFDLFSGYFFGTMDESKWLTRICFLETVAGVPGMVAAMVRHLHSLRLMTRDHGWIHTLLEEAENERMHLLTALTLKKPGKMFRAAVLITQGLFVNFWFFAYLVSPNFCHRFVGYLEEEAVATYTKCLKQLDAGDLPLFAKMPAPDIAIKYWKMPKDAQVRDLLLAIRADEGHHRDVNHGFASQHSDATNPWGPGK